ncbi:hypothetical protein BBD39_06155 [Arsenophonus endosymbiont of Bemisia tabaci Asia II 3]|nr:hypothetical protein BBD39_06155 [Arsenophonus endosymbiont of Bemisia tabaci Asia II 3]
MGGWMYVRDFLPRTDRSGGLEEMIAAAKARVRSVGRVGRGWDMVFPCALVVMDLWCVSDCSCLI